MTSSFFQEPYLQLVLDKIASNEGFKQPKFEVSAGSQPGDNFIGRVFRVKVTETSKTKDEKSLALIFKTSPASKTRQEKMCTKKLFQTESEIYLTVLPTLNKLLKKFGISQSDIFPGTVRCLTALLNVSHSEESDLLVMEDKTAEGYHMVRHAKSLDAEHCRQTIKKLALWHAASLALKHYEPEAAQRLKDIITKKQDLFFNNPSHALLHELKKSAMENLAFIQEDYKLDNNMYEKIENAVRNFNEEIVKANQPHEDLSCIIHGDSWFTNVLFKYNVNGSIQDACLLDLQLVRITSPAVELSYCIFLCTTKEVRDAHYDQLIRYYYTEVTAHLRTMACDPDKIIPWERLQDHLQKYSRVGVLMSVACLPIILADSSDFIVDVNSGDMEGDVFAGCAHVTDPEKLEAISKRVTDVVRDALFLNYL